MNMLRNEQIHWLFCSWNVVESNRSRLNLLSNKMMSHIDVLSSLVMTKVL